MDKYYIIFNNKNLSFEDKLLKSQELANHEINKKIWTENEYFYKDINGNWHKHISYYFGDIRHLPKTDWRFCEVKNARKDVIYNKLVLHYEKKQPYMLKQNKSKDYNAYLDYISLNKS